MLMFSFFILTGISVWIEQKVIRNIPPLYRLMQRYILVSIVLSVLISDQLGKRFGAHGLVTLMAGLTSTWICTLIRKYEPPVTKAVATTTKTVKQFRSAAEPIIMLFKVMGFIVGIMLLPIKGYVRFMEQRSQ